MPSFSRANSMISRFLASWAIWISDLGLTCCDAGIEDSFPITFLLPRLASSHVPLPLGGEERGGGDRRLFLASPPHPPSPSSGWRVRLHRRSAGDQPRRAPLASLV